jgi:choice-of-anchor A domain-containing protein
MLIRISLAVTVAAILFANNAQAGTLLADGYNEFSYGNSTRSGDDQGTAAVGGTATYNNFTLNSSNLTTNPYALVVGGQLAGSQTNMQHGSASYDSKATGTNIYFNGGGHATQQASPINFSAIQSSLTSLSSNLSSLSDTPGVTINNSGYGTITLTGTNSTLNVFNLSGSVFSSPVYDLDITAPAGATVVVNISGKNLTLADLQTQLTNVNGANVLYNFYQAAGSTSSYGLTLTSDAIDGTILAPNAFVNTSNGQLHGQILDTELDGSIETHTDVSPFDGTLPTFAVPEPSSAMMSFAAIVIALLPITRRRLRALTV